jgi:hypothetical protein
MVSERVDNSSDAHHHYPHGTAAQRLGTKVEVFRRFVGNPEFGCPTDKRATTAPLSLSMRNSSSAPNAAL